MPAKQHRGSEWSKWDLHVHTPASFHWSGGKKLSEMNVAEKSASMKSIVDKMNSSDVAAFAVMDYFTFDGVLEVRKFLREQGNIKLEKTLFPGMELRIEAPVDYRLNIHVIFSENVTDQELNDFKSALKIVGTDRQLSDEAIVQSGRSLPQDKAKEIVGAADYQNDPKVATELGYKTIKVTRESFSKATSTLTKEKCLVILPYDTSDGIEGLNWREHPHDDCYFLKQADIFESRSQNSINLFLNVKTERNKTFLANFQENIGGKPKPVISGSDAHKVENYGIYPSGKCTWIKADATFRGLRKTLVEPLNRTFVGEKPEKLKVLAGKSTKFISAIEIKKLPETKLHEIWFENMLHFNPELVAVVGNKGSGKSALADILGLLGNSRQESSFSFLNDRKFREKKGHKAEKFISTVQWLSADSTSKKLSENVDKAAVESVRYIPQSYLEKLCNEITSEESLFD